MMDELITIDPSNKSRKIIVKNEDRTCEVEIARRGIFKGTIEKFYSNGRLDIRLTEMIQEVRE
jgi:hypothetical protein